MRVPPPQASEAQAADARKLVSQLEARALSQATLLQEQQDRLLAYATGQDARACRRAALAARSAAGA